jgi:DNA-binding protein YbaB
MQKMSAEMEKANAQMQNLPPEVREKMEKMMGGAGAVTVTKGGTRKIAGYDAQQYTILMGTNMKMETWNTTGLQMPVPEADLKKLMSFAGAMGPMAQNPMFKGMAKMAEEMKKIQGFPLARTTDFQMMGKSVTSSSEAIEVKTGPVPASAFAIPAGYAKVESPMMKMGGKK